MSIRVREEPPLKHFFIGRLNAWDQVPWGESNLLSLEKEIIWVLIQDHFADWDERVVTVGPDLSHIKDVKSVAVPIFLRHYLHIHSPRGYVSRGQVIKKVLCCIVLIRARELICLLSRQILDSSISLKMILHIERLSFVVDPFEGMRAMAIHVTESIRGPPV